MVDLVVVDIISDPKNKVVTATATTDTIFGEDTVVFTDGVGSARCMEEDRFDEGIGERLAYGRALAALGRQIEREAYQDVYALDRQREAALEGSREAVAARRERTHQFLCEFAELINAKLEQEKKVSIWDRTVVKEAEEEADTVPTRPASLSTGSILRDEVVRSKARQVREELPG